MSELWLQINPSTISFRLLFLNSVHWKTTEEFKFSFLGNAKVTAGVHRSSPHPAPGKQHSVSKMTGIRICTFLFKGFIILK